MRVAVVGAGNVGRGSDERGIIGLADLLPGEAGYAALRAPIAAGGG